MVSAFLVHTKYVKVICRMRYNQYDMPKHPTGESHQSTEINVNINTLLGNS